MSDKMIVNNDQRVLICYRLFTLESEMYSGVASVCVKDGPHDVNVVGKEFLAMYQWQKLVDEGEILIDGGITGYYILPENLEKGHEWMITYATLGQSGEIERGTFSVSYDPDTMLNLDGIIQRFSEAAREVGGDYTVIERIQDAG